ncbi:hypothetical protein FHW58_002343 [Duganella sp. 1224]|uniref:DUF1176 domain-containing protein n=1 Tax=Duganella sp. 1224 TaxID=2587052 RepID=UPI0015CAAB77|nr:DUF1176 domain-containing protein [Duganella sp. 1224]NYE61191.1 hypothetical protein [Duganella sp. 1224]
MRRSLLALGACFGLSLAVASQVQAQQQFSFKDWAVGCDNTRHCDVVGYQAEDAEPAVSLWLGRDGGGSAPLQAKLSAMSADDTGLLTIRVGDVVISGIQEDLTAAQIARLLPAMKKADAAQVSDGKHQWLLSLAGLNAALLKIDDLQGRIGTVTALARPGDKPASTVPAALPAPQLRAAPVPRPRASDAALLPQLLKAIPLGDCSDDLNTDSFSEVHRLSATQLLVLRECGRGAYQSSFTLWRVNDRKPYAPVQLKLPAASGQPRDEILNPSFDNGVLGSFGKGRGIGDCGSFHRWLWTAEGFQLLEASDGPMCRGMPGGGYTLRLWTAKK